MTTPRPEQRLIELVVQTRLEGPDPQDVAELQALLGDPRLRRLYIELVNLHSHLETAHTKHAPDEEAERAALTDVVTTLYASEPEPIHLDVSSPLTRKVYVSALSYVIKYTFTPKRVALLATAAALLLGVVLAIVFLAGGPDESRPIVEAPDRPRVVDRPIVVATLTAERGAHWQIDFDYSAPKPGDALHSGRSLTLTRGFAEITTQRGAVAIVEAPATIELLNNDNALRLHSGKLVGVCETESSKGFVVRTPQMDITDIGTRFAVDASTADQTQVHVIEGSVSYSTHSHDHEPRTLAAGQVISVDTQGNEKQIAFDPHRFVCDREFRARQNAEHSAAARSLASRYGLARAGGVLLDLSFEAGQAGEARATSILDHKISVAVNVDGLVPGRFGDLTAVRLSEDRHSIQASIEQPLQQVTLAGWYYIDRLEHRVTSLIETEFDITSGTHLHIMRSGDAAAMITLVQNRDRGQLKSWADARSDPIQQDVLTGRWVHFAATLDVAAGEAAIYMDGRRIASGTEDDFNPVVLGEFQIGNWEWESELGISEDPIRALRGAVDEFLIVNRALTDHEIAAMYRAGRPTD